MANPNARIQDYNLAYEAEDAVARRIADERARAARRLEGVSTPFAHLNRSNTRSVFGMSSRPELPAPNQDPVGESQNEKSHWSMTVG